MHTPGRAHGNSGHTRCRGCRKQDSHCSGNAEASSPLGNHVAVSERAKHVFTLWPRVPPGVSTWAKESGSPHRFAGECSHQPCNSQEGKHQTVPAKASRGTPCALSLQLLGSRRLNPWQVCLTTCIHLMYVIYTDAQPRRSARLHIWSHVSM